MHMRMHTPAYMPIHIFVHMSMLRSVYMSDMSLHIRTQTEDERLAEERNQAAAENRFLDLTDTAQRHDTQTHLSADADVLVKEGTSHAAAAPLTKPVLQCCAISVPPAMSAMSSGLATDLPWLPP